MGQIDGKKIQALAEGIPGMLATYRIRKAEAATALKVSRQAFHKKINNPSGWKVSELIILFDLVRSKNI